MAGELERLLIRIEADTAILRKELERADKQISGFGDAVDKNLARTERRFSSFSAASKRLLGGLAVGYLVKETSSLSDSYVNMANRLKFVTTSSDELEAVQQRLFAIAQQTRQPVTETTELYSRMAFALKATGASTNEVLQFTENLQKALLLSGASGAEASGALVQLSQGLASGTLRGQELNSILEQTPYIASLIANEMGVTTGELRKLGQEGLITANVLRKAVGGATAELSEQTEKTATTVSQGWTKISNSMLRFVGELNETTGASSDLAYVMNLVAESIDGVTNRIGQATAALKILRGETPTLTDALNLLDPGRKRGTAVDLNAPKQDTTSTAPLGEWKTTTQENSFEGIQQRLDQLRIAALEAQGLQLEAERAAYAIELQTWQDHLDAKLISQEQYSQALGNLQTISNRRQMDAQSRLSDALLSQLAATGAAAFGQNKKWAIAEAAISTYQGVAKAIGAYPPPFNFAMAALVAAQGFVQVAAIRSTTPGSSGGGASVSAGSAGSASSVGASDVGGSSGGGGSDRAIGITLVGRSFDREQIREMIEGLNDAIKDGARLFVK